MPTIDLDALNAAADEEFGEPFVISGVPGGNVSLLPIMRLSKAKRDQVRALTEQKPAPVKKTAAAKSGSPAKRASATKAERDAQALAETWNTIDQVEQLITIAAASAEEGRRLVEYLDGDLGKMTIIAREWQKATQMGEASPSAS